MKQLTKRLLSLCCLLTFVVSIAAPVAVALSANVAGITPAVAAPEHEISVMSFNILEREDTGVYAQPKDRGPMAVKTIKKYNPDIVGIQEAADASSANGNFDWNDYLVTELGKLGYSCRYLTQESVKPSRMTIGAGLMIFYKKDRFDLIAHGSDQYVTKGYSGVRASYEGFTHIDGSRYYHYVKLWDKVQKTYLFTFNTHLAVPPGSLKQSGKEATSAQRTMLANIIRTQSARQLADAIEKLAGDYPCFSTGDYNASWSRSVKDDANSSQLYEMTKNGVLSAAVDDAYSNVSVSRTGIIDHVFYNKFYADSLTYRGVYEEYGGYQPSDHLAMIGYFNYTPLISFKSGSFDVRSRLFTDSTDKDTYTFEIGELRAPLNYKILSSDGQQLSDTVDLPCGRNHFTIELYNGDSLYCTLNATVTCSARLPMEIRADAAESIYYANDGWHVALKKHITALTPTCTDGIFYSDAAATKQLALPMTLSNNITRCWLRTKDDEIIPITIHRESQTAQTGKVLYVDDDIGKASGTVAFSTDKDTILVEGGVNGFGSLAAAAAVANTADGYVIYVAPGHYKGNTVTFSKHVTLLGNNHDVSPLVRADAGWSLATDRREESVIEQRLDFSRKSVEFTVRGFSFVGSSTHAYPVQQTYSDVNTTVTVTVEKNIFRFSGNNTTNSSCIMLNTTCKKAGRVADNYFEQIDDTAASLCRVITARNPYGLVFEENYCVNFTDQLSFISSETFHQSLKDPSHLVMTFRYNRFDNCGPLNLYTQCVDESGRADIQMLYNDFVACGNFNGVPALRLYLSNSNTYITDYSKFDINIFGNRFIGCRRSISIDRGSNEGDIKEARIHINRNRFIGMQQGRTALINLVFNVYEDSQINATSPNWDFSHNYFASDTVSGHHPDNFVSSAVTYNSQTVNSVDKNLYLPYYTNPEMTWLSEGVIQNQTGIRISNNTHAYDGLPHSLDINAGESAVISYSTDPAANRFYSSVKPTLTEPGTLTVYYQVERVGYTNFEGRALITVRVPNRTLKMDSLTLPFDDQPHSLVPLYEPLAGDEITYVYNGVEFNSMPTFVHPGSYTVTMTVNNPYAREITATATLTITAGEITGVGMLVTDDILVTGLQDGDQVLYSVNGNNFTEQKPVLTGNEKSIAVTVSRKGYNDLILLTKPQEASPFTLSLSKDVEGELIQWKMSLLTDKEQLLSGNITLLSYGYTTADTAEGILNSGGTLIALRENETGILNFENEISFFTPASVPTAAFVTFVKDGQCYTVYSAIGV